MSVWEVAQHAAVGRIELTRSVRSWLRAALASDPRVVSLPVTPEIALTAGGIAFLREPGDSVIYATAVEYDARLVSRDSRLHDHDPTRVVW